MELHELHVGEHCASFVGDGHAVAGGDFGVGGFAIDLADAAGGEKNSERANFVKRAVVFVDEADADGATVFKNEAGGERVGAKMQVGNFVRAGKKCAADFASGGIAMRVENARAAVRSFASEGKFGARRDRIRCPIR